MWVLNNVKRHGWLGVLVASALVSCAPRVESGNASLGTTAPSKVSFYPHEAGLKWLYLPNGEPLSNLPYTLVAEGADLLGNLTVQRLHMTGRGTDRVWFKSFNASGVYLHGFTLPGAQVLVTPAWKEYPAENEWKVGASWSGETTLTLSDYKKIQQELKVSYRYTVLDQRTVSAGGKTYNNAWIINKQISGAGALLPESQEFWFVPYVGEVKTPESLVLVGGSTR